MFNKYGSSILEGKGNKGISNKNPFHVYMAQVALLFDNTRQRYKLFESVKFFSEIMNACTSNYYLQPRNSFRQNVNERLSFHKLCVIYRRGGSKLDHTLF